MRLAWLAEWAAGGWQGPWQWGRGRAHRTRGEETFCRSGVYINMNPPWVYTCSLFESGRQRMELQLQHQSFL